ncbi:MAG: biotin--[acetyl-CoA-carboxylase] ligase [Desulfurobacteriaceae bacterium]
MELVELEEVDSTNEYLKRIDFREGFCVIARKQTGGKGRRGKNWLSLKDKGLYISFMYPPLSPSVISLSSLAFGVAVLNTLKSFKEDFYLKWPNDIYINGKKIAGILPELLRDRLIVGIGINLSYSEEELSDFPVPATSLKIERISFNRDQLIKSLIAEINSYYNKLSTGQFNVKEFEQNCPLIGKEIAVHNQEGSFKARALGIDQNGYLIVEDEEGNIKRLFSGDVSVRF